MPITLNGTNGITTPLDVEIQGSTSGSITIAVPAVAGSNTQTLVATTGTLAPVISGTAVASTSGTSIDFTGIPSWVKRITIMFNGVSLSGAAVPIVQLGDSGGIENSGYLSQGGYAGAINVCGGAAYTTGFGIVSGIASNLIYGHMIITLVGSNLWISSHAGGMNAAGIIYSIHGGGSKTLSDTLDRVRITSTNGTDTFDAGSINILYE